ncbi:hypothetical protein Tco_1100941 [Tanacetum coccineum]
MKMEILLEPTSNKLMVEHAEYDESNTYVLERFNTTAGNPVKKILLKLNLSDHRLFKDGGGGKVDSCPLMVDSSITFLADDPTKHMVLVLLVDALSLSNPRPILQLEEDAYHYSKIEVKSYLIDD